MSTCPFCSLANAFYGDDLVLGVWDKFPVAPGHALLVTRRHVATWFDATDAERAALIKGVDFAHDAILAAGHRADGFNICINVGKAAGQTVMHLHVHLIPRVDKGGR